MSHPSTRRRSWSRPRFDSSSHARAGCSENAILAEGAETQGPYDEGLVRFRTLSSALCVPVELARACGCHADRARRRRRSREARPISGTNAYLPALRRRHPNRPELKALVRAKEEQVATARLHSGRARTSPSDRMRAGEVDPCRYEKRLGEERRGWSGRISEVSIRLTLSCVLALKRALELPHRPRSSGSRLAPAVLRQVGPLAPISVRSACSVRYQMTPRRIRCLQDVTVRTKQGILGVVADVVHEVVTHRIYHSRRSIGPRPSKPAEMSETGAEATTSISLMNSMVSSVSWVKSSRLAVPGVEVISEGQGEIGGPIQLSGPWSSSQENSATRRWLPETEPSSAS